MPHITLPPCRPRALAGAISRALLLTSLGLGTGLPAAMAAESASAASRQSYHIAAGSLDSVLNRYADQAGILLVVDAQLTAGKSSPGLDGSYSISEGFTHILTDSGLQAIAQGNGSYMLRKAPPAATGSHVTELATVNVTAQLGDEDGSAYTTRSASTATGLKLSPRETPQAVTVVTRARMDDQATNDISTVLDQAVGVSVNATSAVGTDGINFYARGFDIKNFQIDGSPRPPAIYGFSETTTDMAVYDRVEIVRGANGLMSGAGSPSAAVNLVRKRPTAEKQASVGIQIGSWNHSRLEVDASGALTPSGKVRGRVVAVHQDSDSHLDRANLKKDVLYGIAEVDLTEKTLLTVGMEYQDFTNSGASRGGVPLFFTDGSKTHFDRSTNTGAAYNEFSHQTTRFFGSLEHFFDNGWSARLEAEESRPDYDEAFSYLYGAFDAATGAGSTMYTARWAGDLRQRIVGLNASGPFRLLGRQHDLMVGASYNTAEDAGNDYPGWWSGPAYMAAVPDARQFLATGQYARPALNPTGSRYGGRIEQTAAYAATRLKPSDAVSVILGSRVSNWKESEWDTYSGSKSSRTLTNERDVVTPYAGIVVDLNDQLSAYASYADIFEPQSVEDQAGKRLDPLVGASYEIGLKGEFNGGKLNTTAALFRIEQDNFAVAIPGAPLNANGNTPYRAESGTVSQGFELEANGEVAEGWRLGGGYAYAKPKDANDAQLLTEIPKETVKLFSTYQLPGAWQALTVGGNLRWQGKSFAAGSGPNGEDFVQHDLAVIDVMARYAISKQVSAALNVNNLFDKTYYSGFSWDHGVYAAPRNVMLSLKWSL